MNGIFLIDKDIGLTSRDVVNRLGKRLGSRKMGHVGTLDPLASGLLVITSGRATKISSYLETLDKEYVATLTLGEDTTTMDSEGEVVFSATIPSLSEERINEVLETFIGDTLQRVPLYSAIKVAGKELYKYARKGEEVAPPTRLIHIDSLRLISFDKTSITFAVVCQKGTYIRSLGQDIAHALESAGHLTSLRRTRIGRFEVTSAKSYEQITPSDALSISEALAHLPHITLNEEQVLAVRQGKVLSLLLEDDLLLALDEQGEASALLWRDEDHLYRVKRGLE